MPDANALLSGTASTYEILADLFGVSVGTAIVILFIISVWALIWKGIALWKSAKKGSKVWFVVLLVLNTVGILEILYIFIFSKISPKVKKKLNHEIHTTKPAPKKKKK